MIKINELAAENQVFRNALWKPVILCTILTLKRVDYKILTKRVQKRIIALLGENAYNGDVLNRQFVASVVFDNAGLLKS